MISCQSVSYWTQSSARGSPEHYLKRAEAMFVPDSHAHVKKHSRKVLSPKIGLSLHNISLV